jgi:hypothetical protein
MSWGVALSLCAARPRLDRLRKMQKNVSTTERPILADGFYPRESDASDGIAQHVAQDGRVGVSGGKVGVEPRVLPVGHLE